MSTATCRNRHPRNNANTTVTKTGVLRCLACRRVAAKRKPCTMPGCDAHAAHDDGYCALHHALAITAHKRRPAAADAEWWDRAACRGLDGLYDGLSSVDRRRLCDSCPVQGPCRADGEQQDYLTQLASISDAPLYGGLHARDLSEVVLLLTVCPARTLDGAGVTRPSSPPQTSTSPTTATATCASPAASSGHPQTCPCQPRHPHASTSPNTTGPATTRKE